MGLFDKFKKKKEMIVTDETEIITKKELKANRLNLTQMNNYMLTDIRKENLSNNGYCFELTKLSKIAPIATPIASKMKNIIEQNPETDSKLYRITNLGKNDSLKAMSDGKTFWGAIKKSDGTSTMAKLKQTSSKKVMALDPTIVMMSVALIGIEAELEKIEEWNKKILSFLEEEKESEIESDLEMLNRFIMDFRYNLGNEKYLVNNHKQVMDIKRTANKNMLFYKKQIKDDLLKNKLFTTNSVMNSIINEIEKKFKYYRLSFYIYSFSSFMEILLLGNYQTDYLQSKRTELEELEEEYSNVFQHVLDYIKNNANKSLEGNVLLGIGGAGKAIGNLVEKAQVKNVDTWLNEKGENLEQIGQNIKDSFANKFNEIKDSNSKTFRKQIEKIDCIYNKTKEIYFDKEKIYLETE